MVIGLGIGSFGGLSAGFSGVCTFIAQSCDILSGSLRQQVAQGGPGHVPLKDPPRVDAAIFAWSDLVLDRSRKLVGLQSPVACATRAGGDSGPNFENFDLFHAQFTDTGHGARARSWRTNRGVNDGR